MILCLTVRIELNLCRSIPIGRNSVIPNLGDLDIHGGGRFDFDRIYILVLYFLAVVGCGGGHLVYDLARSRVPCQNRISKLIAINIAPAYRD